MKKKKLTTLRVLSPVALDREQRAVLAVAWKQLRHEPLRPISQLHADSTRRRIDAALASVLGIKEEVLAGLRDLLGSEPRFRPATTTHAIMRPDASQQPLF